MSRIIVADDDEDIRAVYQRGLERAGHEVVAIADGRQVLGACREHQTELVLLDILMPDQDGIETIVELQKELPEVKIIAISGGGSFGDPGPFFQAAKALGAVRVLRKPVEMKQLVQAVQEQLDVQ